MEHLIDSTISGFNEYIQSVQRDNPTAEVSVTMFSQSTGFQLANDTKKPHNSSRISSNYRPLVINTAIKQVPKLTRENYRPHGNTPLLDALGYTITQIRDHVKAHKTKPTVLFVIMTDGEENASTEWTLPKVLTLISNREKKGWKIIYLGANQDQFTADSIATGLGLPVGAAYAYSGQNTKSVFRGMASSTTSLAASPNMTSADVAHMVSESVEKKTIKSSKARTTK